MAAYLISKIPSDVLKGKSPYEALFDVVPNLSQLRVFVAYVFLIIYKLKINLINVQEEEFSVDILLEKRI